MATRRRTTRTQRPICIVDGSRTPYIKVRTGPGPFRASDLAVAAAQPLLARMPFAAEAFDEVILGCIGPGPDEVNIGRVVALRLGCGDLTPGWTVQRNCASGMQAIDSAIQSLQLGRADLVLAGGVESMSHAPVLFTPEMAGWLGRLNAARTVPAKLKVIAELRGRHLKPVIGLLRGLTDPVVGLSMGQTAEVLAERFGISRTAMDEFAVRSHQRLARAQDANKLSEIVPVFTSAGTCYDFDDGLRRDSNTEALAKLKPVFDREFGAVTAGNSAQITDGAAWLMLASEKAVETYNLPVLARIIDSQWAGLDPRQMGLGPVHAVAPLLKRAKLDLAQIDYWEINEAFAAQVLACLAAFRDEDYCREAFDLKEPLGEIDEARLNVDGGAIALGHPVGSSGARIVLHLAQVLARENANRGIAAICIGGGQGGAMLLEREAA